MARLTWLGEDELHNGNPGPSFTTAFGGIKFPKGEAVEVTDKETSWPTSIMKSTATPA